MKPDNLIFFFLQILILIESVLGLSKNNPNGLDTYTKEEFKKIPVLREKAKDVLVKPYMSGNAYLVRYLRARNGNLNEAEALIRENYEWRVLNDVKTIAATNYSRWQYRFTYTLNVDREGRPGIAVSLRGLDVRRMVLRGVDKDFRNYIIHIVERFNEAIPLYGKMVGKEFISVNVLYNLAGFNARSHVCLACIPFWVEILGIYQNQYPNLAKTFFAINVPRAFQTLLQALKHVITDQTLKQIEPYGLNKGEWRPLLLKKFAPEELPREFGGTAVQKHWSETTFPQHVVFRKMLKSLNYL